VHVADLGDEDRCQGRTHTGDLLDREIAPVAGQLARLISKLRASITRQMLLPRAR
jgi:hypothetical protein